MIHPLPRLPGYGSEAELAHYHSLTCTQHETMTNQSNMHTSYSHINQPYDMEQCDFHSDTQIIIRAREHPVLSHHS